jgi:hypothetical protein
MEKLDLNKGIIYTLVLLLFTTFAQSQTPNYYYGLSITKVDSAFKSWLNWDELLYLEETGAQWAVIGDTVPKFNGVEEVFEWWSGIRGFYTYCLGDVVVRYDPEQKLWYYECLNNKLQHIEWQDTKRGRRVYEHVEDKNGKTLRHYDAHDPEMIICWGYGCPVK